MRFGRVAAHDDLRLGVADVVETIGHRAVAPGVGDAGDRGRMADAGLVVGVVGAPEGAQFAEQIGALVGELGRAQPVDRIRPRFLADRHELVADLVDRLVPLHPGPFALDELQRVFEAALAGDELAHRGALGAMRPAVDRAVPARLLADPDAIGDLGGDRAADRAMGADAFADRDLPAAGRWRPSPGLLYPPHRQGTQPRQPPRPQARAAPE